MPKTSVRLIMGRLRALGSLLFLQVVALCVANTPPSLSGKVVPRVIAKLGEITHLGCPVSKADPELTTWKKDGQSLPLGWDRLKVSRKGHLRIKDTQMTDAGVYTCIAANGFGHISINYTVLVLDEATQMVQEGSNVFKQMPNEDLKKQGFMPFFEDLEKMKEKRKVVKPKGSAFRLLCRAKGNPAPDLLWYKNSEVYNQRKPTLKIQDITAADNGDYTCVASNRLGQTNFTYHVKVIEEITKPRLIAPHPLTQRVQAGGKVSFQCFIESEVDPEVWWLKQVDTDMPNVTLIDYESENLMVLKGAGIQLEVSEGSFLNKLVIPKVSPRDAGKYFCMAINKEGSVARSAFLHVDPDEATHMVQVGSNLFNEDLKKRGSDAESLPHDSSDSDNNLPFLIGLPTCAVLVIILLVVFLMLRNKGCCCCRSSTSKVPRAPVPPTEREAYYYSNCQQQPQTVNPLLASREKLPKTPTPSMDMTGSEFSSVSRTHPNPHYYHQHHMNYGY